MDEPLIVKKACNPSDILWENYAIDKSKRIKNILKTTILIVLILMFLGTIVFRIK